MKSKFSADFWVQLGIMIVASLCMLGSLVTYTYATFATKSEVQTEIEERRELKAEVDQIYMRDIPESQRKPLLHHHYVGAVQDE